MRLFIVIVLAVGCSTVHAAENWPDFRGPDHSGHSDATGLPVEWSEQSNVKWKTAIHDLGWSSPVIWGNQIWMTTATEDGTKLYAVCIDKRNGTAIHDRLVFDVPDPEPLGNDLNCYATPSAAVEEGYVYVHFGTYGTACLNSQSGNVIWQRRNINGRHWRGPASSPFIYQNLLILTFDCIDRQYVTALDKTTGDDVWTIERSTEWDDIEPDGSIIANGDMRKAYGTPIIVEVDGRAQMISTASKSAFAYDPLSGEVIWSVSHLGHSNASRPLVGHGMVYIATGYAPPEMWAIRPGGSGAVTDTHVAWKFKRGVPLRASAILVDDLIYMTSDSGIANCIDAKTGEPVWRQRFGSEFSASPVYADGRIYFFNQRGNTTVIKPGRTFEQLATNQLDAGFMASPAISGKAIYLRTKTHLYRIEK